MSLQGGLSIERMCQLAGVSKASFYRHLRSQDIYDEEMHVRSEIQSVALHDDCRRSWRISHRRSTFVDATKSMLKRK